MLTLATSLKQHHSPIIALSGFFNTLNKTENISHRTLLVLSCCASSNTPYELGKATTSYCKLPPIKRFYRHSRLWLWLVWMNLVSKRMPGWYWRSFCMLQKKREYQERLKKCWCLIFLIKMFSPSWVKPVQFFLSWFGINSLVGSSSPSGMAQTRQFQPRMCE